MLEQIVDEPRVLVVELDPAQAGEEHRMIREQDPDEAAGERGATACLKAVRQLAILPSSRSSDTMTRPPLVDIARSARRLGPSHCEACPDRPKIPNYGRISRPGKWLCLRGQASVA